MGKLRGKIIDRFGDENGDLARLVVSPKGNYYIEQVVEGFSPNAGKVSRTWYANKKEVAEAEFENLRVYYMELE